THDDQEVIPGEPGDYVLESLAVHRQMHLRSLPIFQNPPPGDAGLDPKGPTEAPHDSADRPFEAGVSRRDEYRIGPECTRREGDVRRHPFVSGRTVAQSKDRDHASVLEPDDPMAPKIEARRSFHE